MCLIWPCSRVWKWDNKGIRISVVSYSFEQAGMKISLPQPLYQHLFFYFYYSDISMHVIPFFLILVMYPVGVTSQIAYVRKIILFNF